jgi:hypothetical protein
MDNNTADTKKTTDAAKPADTENTTASVWITAAEVFSTLTVIASGHAFSSYLLAKRFQNDLDPFIKNSVTVKDIIVFAEHVQLTLCMYAIIISIALTGLFAINLHKENYNKSKVFFEKLIDFTAETFSIGTKEVQIILLIIFCILMFFSMQIYFAFSLIFITCFTCIVFQEKINKFAFFSLVYFIVVVSGTILQINKNEYYSDSAHEFNIVPDRFKIITTEGNEKILYVSNIERYGDFLNVTICGKNKLIGVSSVFSIEPIEKKK